MTNTGADQPPNDAVLATAFPQLTSAQMARLQAYGAPQDIHVGDIVFQPGDDAYDLILIDEGEIQILTTATRDTPEAAVATHGPGRFVGELNLITGQAVYLTARVTRAGRVHRVPPDRFRAMMAEDPELSDLVLRSLLARRAMLRDSPAAGSIEIIGSGMSAPALALRTYAARQQLPHLWFDADSVGGQAVMHAIPLEPGDLPAVVTPGRVLKRATTGEFAEHLGLSYHRSADKPVDLAVIGGGPAGLAAAVYGASEGLATVLLDAVAAGGQAAASSRIENYLGFPSGLSGAELTGRAAIQALKFGAELSSPCQAVKLDASGAHLRVFLTDGTEIATRAVVIATGARYRSLPLARWKDFEGAGIYYAATELEARACEGSPVAVLGGANSAGQAALYLASRGNSVHIIIRGDDLSAGMSSYLTERLIADPRVTIQTGTQITGLDGGDSLQKITLTDRKTGDQHDHACQGLFCFIGAEPATDWLDGVAMDEDGFVRTDVQLVAADLGDTWTSLGRMPLPFETNIPAVFAVGDVRHGSMKRVAAAVGEGASAVRSVHAAIGVQA